MNATPTKLKSGAWGARVQSSAVEAGDTITITTRSGKSWDAVVSRVLWTGDGVALCATGPSGSGHRRDPVARRAASATRRAGGRACRECGGYVQPWSNGAAAGYCHDCC